MPSLAMVIVRHAVGVTEQVQRLIPVGQAVFLDQCVGDVDPEAVNAPVEPEPQDVLELGPNLRVLPVEVRLLGGEKVEVPLSVGAAGNLDPGPGGAAEDALPVVRRKVPAGAPAIGEDVALPLGAARLAGQCGLEPGVLIGGVVGHEVHDDLQAEVVGSGKQGVSICQRSEDRVDVAVVGDVVARVRLGRDIER